MTRISLAKSKTTALRRPLAFALCLGWIPGVLLASQPHTRVTTMTANPKTFWQLLATLATEPILNRPAIEAALGATLTEVQEPSNTAFMFFRGGRLTLSDRTIIAKVDLRIKRTNPSVGLLVMDVGGRCITLADVRTRYGALNITDAPRGRSPDETTVHTSYQPWGRLSFGFAESNPDCVAHVVFDPRT